MSGWRDCPMCAPIWAAFGRDIAGLVQEYVHDMTEEVFWDTLKYAEVTAICTRNRCDEQLHVTFSTTHDRDLDGVYDWFVKSWRSVARLEIRLSKGCSMLDQAPMLIVKIAAGPIDISYVLDQAWPNNRHLFKDDFVEVANEPDASPELKHLLKWATARLFNERVRAGLWPKIHGLDLNQTSG